MPRALVADLGASFAAVRDACPTSRRVESPETQLRDEWRTRGVPYQAYPFAATLLRNEGHLDCGYFRHTAFSVARALGWDRPSTTWRRAASRLGASAAAPPLPACELDADD